MDFGAPPGPAAATAAAHKTWNPHVMMPDCIPIASLAGFEQPWWLFAAVAAAGPVLLAIRAGRRGRQIPRLNVALQCLAVLAATIALARPTAAIGPRARKSVLVLRDVSASCRGQSDRPVRLPAELPAERFDFAAAVAPAAVAPAMDPNRTRLGPALRLALARRDELAGLLIRTDGRFTDADWRQAAAAIGRAGLPVTVALMESPPPDVRMEALSAERAPDGTVRIALTVRSNALARRTVTLTRTRPPAAKLLLTKRLDLLPGQPATLRMTDAPPDSAAIVYRAELSPADAFAENDAAEALLPPASRRLAVVGGDPPRAAALAAATALPVETLAPRDAPATAGGWMDYAAVVLVDATGTLLAAEQRAALAEYVRAGGGLVLLGAGPHGSPDDRDAPLNRIAALVANPYQRKPLALTVVLDASGSMAQPAAAAADAAGRIKFHRAAQAVLALKRHLTDADALSVIAFSDSAKRIYDSGGAPPDFAALADALDRVRPAGPTDVREAMELASQAPAPPGRDGLVLVVSDLLTKAFRPDLVAERFRRHRLSLAVVAIADAEAPAEPSPLETTARLLSAPVIRRNSLIGLAEVFASLLRGARGRALRRGRFQAAMVREALGRPTGALPEVEAYLLCAPQDGAEVHARVGPQQDALLASRRAGLGRTVSLALPAAPDDNPAWERSGELQRLLGAAAGWVLRPAGDSRFVGKAYRRGEALRIDLVAADGDGPMNLLQLTARVRPAGPDAPVRNIELEQTAPGRYEAAATLGPEPAHVAVGLAGGPVVWMAAVGRTAPPEFAAVGADWENLRLLAELTGGRIAPAAKLADLSQQWIRRGRTDLWPVLLAVAAALMLADWALARILRRAG